MITLITGTPGAGKTLFTLAWVKTKADKESRVVYYSGIPDLKLPWLELEDATEWHKLPSNSIIVIDEAQRVFRPRGSGSAVPEYISKFETHRHQGLDVILITQHPMLIDQNIRRLVGQHFHGVRKFGLQSADFHEWGACHEITKNNLAVAVRHKFGYPKEVFSYYKSAEVHTHKRNLPARVYFLMAAPLLVIVLGVYGFQKFRTATDVKANIEKATGQKSLPAPTGGAAVAASEIKTTQEWIAEQTPRIAGLAHTAPIYDALTVPQEVPIPALCMDSAKRGCSCKSQQGTALEMSQEMCKSIIKQGMFIAWDRPRSDPGVTPGARSDRPPVYPPLDRQDEKPARESWVHKPAPTYIAQR